MNSARLFRIAAVILVLALLANMFGLGSSPKVEGPAGATHVLYSEFLHNLKGGEIVSIAQVAGSSTVTGRLKAGGTIYTFTPGDDSLIKEAVAAKVAVDIAPPPPQSSGRGFQIMLAFVPVLLLVLGFWWLQRRSAQGGGMGGLGAMRSGNSRLRDMVPPEDNPVRLPDVAGCDDAKREVSEIIDFLKNPEDYRKVGARSPHGILMSGPPGTGKTLLAKAIAGEAGVPFYSVSGSDFTEMFVGVGAARVRNLFEEARKHAPAIIFIDEIDSVARTRSGNNMSGTQEHEQTLNALLIEMDGFTPATNVVVIAATNRSDVLDPAATRPGRFDREVSLPLPDRQGRTDILKTHSVKVPMSDDVDLAALAKGTPGFSGADLANLINEGAILAARDKDTLVHQRHLEAARDKVVMGIQASPLTNESERRVVAYHEAGHAVVAHFSPLADPVHKISIVPRGRALGVTMQLPREDSYNHSSARLRTDLTVMMGGRAGEDVALGSDTVGASNDFHRATVLARRMVTSWGMDKDMGPVSLDGERGNEWAQTNVWSETLKVQADMKVQQLLKDSYALAHALLTKHRDALERVAQGLLSVETLDAAAFEALAGPSVHSDPLLPQAVTPPIPPTTPLAGPAIRTTMSPVIHRPPPRAPDSANREVPGSAPLLGLGD